MIAATLSSLQVSVEAATVEDEIGPVVTSPDEAVRPDPADAEQAERGSELIAARTESSKTFVTDQPGVYLTELSTVPLHREGSDGRWVDLDPSLVAGGDGRLRPRSLPVDVSLAATADDPALGQVRLGEAAVGFALDGAAPVLAEQTEDGGVVYADAVGTVDVELSPTRAGLKEHLVLETAEESTFRFPLTIEGGLTPEIDDTGAVAFREPDGVLSAIHIPRGWMQDSGTDPRLGQGAFSDAVDYQLEDSREGWTLVVSADEEWLSSPDRVFPVRVDPTISLFSPAQDDTFVNSYFPTADLSSLTYMNVGANALWDGNRGYLHLPDLSGPLADMTIHVANLTMWQTAGYRCDVVRDLYRVEEAWAGSTTMWNNQPDVGDVIATSTTSFGATGCAAPGQITYSITDAARNWADGTWDNHGVSLWPRNAGLTSPSQSGTFGSADNTLYAPLVGVLWSDPTEAGVPNQPEWVTPDGPITTLTPELRAPYVDPDNEQGYAVFVIYDDETNQQVHANLGTLVASGNVSAYTVPAGVLAYERTYRLEAIAVEDPTGAGNPFDGNLAGSVHTEVTFTPTTAPEDPVDINTVGITAERTPTLTATYTDRNAQNGRVEFEIVDVATDLTVTVLNGTTVASGSPSSATVPEGLLDFGETYWVRSTAIDSDNLRSLTTVSTTLGIESPSAAAFGQDFPDPAIARDGNTYYAFATNFITETLKINVPRVETGDISDWSAAPRDDALPTSAMGSWADPDAENTWAPGIGRFGGNWVLYYGGIVKAGQPNAGTRCIGTATSTTLGGAFIDGDGQATGTAETPLVCELGGVIDPSVFRDTNGTPYLLWKTDNVPSGQVHLKIRQLDATGRAFAGAETTLLTSNSTVGQNWEKIDATAYQMEQPEMVRRAGKYLLFYSGNNWESRNYAVGYAECDTPTGPCQRVTTDAVGPWFVAANSDHDPRTFETATSSGPGAASFVTDQLGGTWMAHHAWVDPDKTSYLSGGARGLFIEKVHFNPGAPVLDLAHAPGQGMIDIDPANALGGGNSAGHGINERGEVAGIGFTAGGESQGIWWDRTLLLEDLDPATLEDEAEAYAINDNSVIAGKAFEDLVAGRAVKWFPELPPNPFVGPVDYLVPRVPGGSAVTWANDTNNASLTVGASTGAGTPIAPTWWGLDGKAHRLFTEGAFAASYGHATAVNGWGDIAGELCTGWCTGSEAFYKPHNGPPVGLGSLGGNTISPNDVNNQGVVVGTATLADDTPHAFVWDGQLVDIGAGLPGALESHAEGINDHGQVVGWYLDSSGNAQGFLWKDDVFIAPIGDLGGGQTKAYAINNRGLITGTSRTTTDQWHAFLLSGPDPTEAFDDTPSVIIGGPGGTNLPPGPAPIGFPPGTDPAGHQICLNITIDTANVPVIPYFNLVYADVTMSDPNGDFYSINLQLADNTQNHPLPGGVPPSFNTDNHWPVTVTVEATYPEWGVLSWDLEATTC